MHFIIKRSRHVLQCYKPCADVLVHPPPAGLLHYPSSVPAVPPLLMANHPPVMCSKAQKQIRLPDQPDYSGMCERRRQSEMTVRKDLASHGLQPEFRLEL